MNVLLWIGLQSVAVAAVIPPFSITTKTELKGGVSTPGHYPAYWTAANPGYYVNKTGRALVLKSLTAVVQANPSLEDSAMDICLVIGFPGMDWSLHTVNGMERLCFSQKKGKTNWPVTTLKVPMPGRGHLVPDGAMVFCNSQAAAAQTGLAWASQFECRMDFDDAAASSNRPVVQALRVPFADQSFTGSESFSGWHTNRGSSDIKTHGVWVYPSTLGETAEICFFIKTLGSTAKRKWCYTPTTNVGTEKWNTPITIRGLQVTLRPRESFTARCLTTAGKEKFCAFYLMVETSTEQALYPSDTVSESEARRFCTSGRSYKMSEKKLSDSTFCESALKQSAPPLQ